MAKAPAKKVDHRKHHDKTVIALKDGREVANAAAAMRKQGYTTITPDDIRKAAHDLAVKWKEEIGIPHNDFISRKKVYAEIRRTHQKTA